MRDKILVTTLFTPLILVGTLIIYSCYFQIINYSKNQVVLEYETICLHCKDDRRYPILPDWDTCILKTKVVGYILNTKPWNIICEEYKP